MNNKTIEEKIQDMVDRIVEKFDPDKIILFGSHARGDARPDSDVDLMVVFSGVEESTIKLAGRMYAHIGAIGLSKDIVVATSKDLVKHRHNPWYIYKTVLDEGKVLYDKAA